MSPEPFVPLATLDAVRPGHPAVGSIDGREIGLFNVDGTIFAIDNTCPHQGGPLTDGWVEQATVVCPWHAWCFNLADGSMTLGSFAHVDSFDVRIEGDTVWVSRFPRPRPA